jgi:hypothetical protein
MSRLSGRTPALWIVTLAGLLSAVVMAQPGPIDAMFGDAQKRLPALAPSFLRSTLPQVKRAPSSLRVYFGAGDLERAFDHREFRPDAAVVPTNTDLAVAAASPPTQRVLVDRVQKHPEVMRDLQEQIDARRKQHATTAGRSDVLEIAVDSFMAQLPRGGAPPAAGAFPRAVCLIATDFAAGGAIDRRELFTQDRMRKGIAGCLTALDASGVRSVILPLVGAASSATQANDPVFEGQRLLKECRLLNAVAGIALGIHDFAPGRRSIREIGIVQWDREITDMFSSADVRVSKTADLAYKTYAEQTNVALQNGLTGKRLTPAEVGGNCNATFNPR